MIKVAALYVDIARGPYARMAQVQAWGEEHRAQDYAGPWPIVAHPDCGPWSKLAYFCGPDLLSRKWLAVRAVEQVRQFGGVLEHPANSALWKRCRMPKPNEAPDRFGGCTILVEQWWWGHRAAKPTWLYIVGADRIPPAPRTTSARPPTGRARFRHDPNRSMLERMGKHERHLTPPMFAEWLVELAAGCRGGGA